MSKRRLLSEKEIQDALKKLDGWEIRGGKLHKEFRFDSFPRAFGFMAAAAATAEGMNHHPEWFNVYNVVRVDLVTHDLKGISSFDVLLAERMNQLARSS